MGQLVSESNQWRKSYFPVQNVMQKTDLDKESLYEEGLKIIHQRKIAIVLLASEYAFFSEDDLQTISLKMLPMPSRKTNLQMILERITCLIKKGYDRFGFNEKDKYHSLPIYIMAAEKFSDSLYTHLEKLNFLNFSNLFVFPQKDLPSFNHKGEINMRSPKDIYSFPNGSGGLFSCMQSYELLSHM